MIDIHVHLPNDTCVADIERTLEALGINYFQKTGPRMFVAAPMPPSKLRFDVQGRTNAVGAGRAGTAPPQLLVVKTDISPVGPSQPTAIAGYASVPVGLTES